MRPSHVGPTPAWKPRRFLALAVVGLLALGLVVAVAGCGKPEYCSDRSSLEQSVNGLGDVKVLESGGVQELKTQLGKVESDTNALVSSAKSDFPSETTDMQSSVTKLKTAVDGLPADPSREQLVALAADVKGTVTAFGSFKSATDSKC